MRCVNRPLCTPFFPLHEQGRIANRRAKDRVPFGQHEWSFDVGEFNKGAPEIRLHALVSKFRRLYGRLLFRRWLQKYNLVFIAKLDHAPFGDRTISENNIIFLSVSFEKDVFALTF